MPTLEHTVLVPYLDPDADPARLAKRHRAGPTSRRRAPAPSSASSGCPFDHPLWVLYSSGTTGLPKAIVQGQGGILLEHLKKLGLHVDAQEGDRIFWFTTTGWMMWNFLVSALLTPASVVLYDGSPGHPDMDVLWDLAERTGMTCFGTSASYVAACMKAGVEPGAGPRPLARCEAVGSTGSPLAPEGFQWVYDHVGADTWLFSTSGGTDVCTAFVGGVPLLPVYRGELQARALGAQGRGLGRGGQAGGRRGRRAGHHRADAVDAAVLLGRRRRLALPRQPTSSTSPASGATATGSRSPRAAPRSSTAAPTRPSTARASAWARARSTAPSQAVARGPRRARRRRPAPRHRGLDAAVRRPARGRGADDELTARDQAPDPRAVLAAPRPERGLRDRRGASHALGQGARGPGEADPHGHARREGGQPRLARQPRRARLVRRARATRPAEARRPLKGTSAARSGSQSLSRSAARLVRGVITGVARTSAAPRARPAGGSSGSSR